MRETRSTKKRFAYGAGSHNQGDRSRSAIPSNDRTSFRRTSINRNRVSVRIGVRLRRGLAEDPVPTRFRREYQRPPNDVLTFASAASPATPTNHWRSDRGFIPGSRHVGVRTWMDRSRIRNRTSPLPDQTYEVPPMRLPGTAKPDWIQGEADSPAADSASPTAAGGAASGPITSSPERAFFIAATTPSGVTALSAQ